MRLSSKPVSHEHDDASRLSWPLFCHFMRSSACIAIVYQSDQIWIVMVILQHRNSSCQMTWKLLQIDREISPIPHIRQLTEGSTIYWMDFDYGSAPPLGLPSEQINLMICELPLFSVWVVPLTRGRCGYVREPWQKRFKVKKCSNAHCRSQIERSCKLDESSCA